MREADLANIILRAAALAAALGLFAGTAAANCQWDIGMAERDLGDIAVAAPLAAFPDLEIGPGTSSFISGSDRDLADRTRQAFAADKPLPEGGEDRYETVERGLADARVQLELARQHAARGDELACAEALDLARQALAGARAAFH